MSVSIPPNCHLWTKNGLTAEDIRSSLAPLTTYEDESHLRRLLLKCKVCGQLYFYEFYEIVDWDNGNDAQYWTWIPVEDAASAARLSTLSPLELLQYSGLRVDFPSNAERPTAPQRTLRVG